ncbi:YHS domain-containing (seleno)protein [Agarivorans albus]|uniref:YHS domain-containing protein n=1 Tax=Agarivorans albus MKT 106 TaxID=1331007 RepID=R9PP97_AGAAL|nr:YHS domain-containing (seleno)protein [Agarivorans albus]GAC99925.1 hypothetical protein AALB_0006 [Agarivorans albus MKT 106]
MKQTIFATTCLIFSLSSFANEPVSTSFWSDKAIGGIDITSYQLAQEQANRNIQQGNKKYTVRWKEANWQFASQQSADKFAASPETYQAKYNGFCANALSLGEGLIATDGQVWEFFDNQLHLFFAEKGRQRWLKGDWKAYQQQADLAWKQALQ